MEYERDSETVELNQELIDEFGDQIESTIEKILNKKDWDSFAPELLVVLMEMAVQTAEALGMEEGDFREFVDQFLVKGEEQESSLEIFNINTRVKNNDKPN